MAVRIKIILLLAGMALAGFFAIPLKADETSDDGRENVIRSSSNKDIVITSYDPAAGMKNMTQKDKIRTRRVYANWISGVLAQWKRKESGGSEPSTKMSARELRKAYETYLRFLRNIEVSTSPYLNFIPDLNERRKIIRRLAERTREKLKQLQSGS